MGVSVVRYKLDHEPASWGVLQGENVHQLALEAADHREVMMQWFENRAVFRDAIAQESTPLNQLQLLAPLSSDIQFFCQGLNYASHRAESGVAPEGEDEENLLFMKAGSSICGATDNIVRPAGCELLDYEIELGLVLRRPLREPTEIDDTNLDLYVGALILCNDVSARDLMFGAPMIQWFRGKSQRTFCPAGPVLFLLDDGDLQQLYSLELNLWMNGELKQHAITDQLIHKPPKTLTEISAFADLDAGDCVLTGTPGGILAGHTKEAAMALLGNFFDDQKRRKELVVAQLEHAEFLKPGDILELQIKSLDGRIDLGKQRNMIVDA